MSMKPRTRYLVPEGSKQLPSSQYDQKIVRDMRMPGSVPLVTQYKKTKRYNNIERQKNHKHYPLKNGLPFVPIYQIMQKSGAINLFNPDEFTLVYAKSQLKEPYDSLLKEHRMKSFVKATQKMQVLADRNVIDDKIRWIDNDDIGLQEKYFLEDRPHGLQRHRNINLKQGHVKVNRFESNARAFENMRIKNLEESLDFLKSKKKEDDE